MNVMYYLAGVYLHDPRIKVPDAKTKTRVRTPLYLPLPPLSSLTAVYVVIIEEEQGGFFLRCLLLACHGREQCAEEPRRLSPAGRRPAVHSSVLQPPRPIQYITKIPILLNFKSF